MQPLWGFLGSGGSLSPYVRREHFSHLLRPPSCFTAAFPGPRNFSGAALGHTHHASNFSNLFYLCEGHIFRSMVIRLSQLRRIIKEEVQRSIKEYASVATKPFDFKSVSDPQAQFDAQIDQITKLFNDQNLEKYSDEQLSGLLSKRVPNLLAAFRAKKKKGASKAR